MKRWLHKVEVVVDWLVPICLLLLIGVIAMDVGFSSFVAKYNLGLLLDIIDYFVLAVFVLDLVFKYMSVRNIPMFLRKYWLELLAVFPFFLFFRLIEFASSIATLGKSAAALQRSTRLSRFISPLLRTPRFLETFPRMLHFFEKPTGEHYGHEMKH